jgi:acyl-CoA synthetase (AMP-forming)/AMP-acid ligase II
MFRAMHLGEIAARTPDRPAVIMAGSGRVITYRELNEESNRLAQLLYAEGLRPGDHIAFMLENHPLFLAVAWAAQRSGLYYTAVSSRLQADELTYIVDNCEAKAFISSAALTDVAVAIADRTPGV